MKTHRILLLPLLALALLVGGAAGVSAAAADDLRVVLGHYEAVRQALLADRTAGVAGHAAAIEKTVRGLAAGAPGSRDAGLQALLPEVAAAASRLAMAKDLKAARAAFGDLSNSLIRWREAAGGPGPVVVYCSMVKKSWLQPKGELGNPYYGQEMARCGEVVSKSR